MPPHVDALLAVAADGIAFDGLSVEYDGTYQFETPNERHEGISEQEIRALAVDSPFVRNWHFWHERTPQHEPKWAFLRWLEGRSTDGSDPEMTVPNASADGPSQTTHTQTWGQLHLTVTVTADGTRQYGVRHREDTADESVEHVETEPLERLDPTGVRDRTRFDDRGRYRPLKTAPTLPTGWVAPALSPVECLRLVGWVYPASVENWYRERTGDLDLTHWDETMARQSGMYGVIKTWNRRDGHDHVEWVAQACCADSQCLKRRVWEYDVETPLETPGGDGEFPCREPCSLVISAARRWTRQEGERPQRYEIELTPTENAQLTRILDAVADGDVTEIREAAFEDGANRWRARFLRSKLSDENEALPFRKVDSTERP